VTSTQGYTYYRKRNALEARFQSGMAKGCSGGRHIGGHFPRPPWHLYYPVTSSWSDDKRDCGGQWTRRTGMRACNTPALPCFWRRAGYHAARDVKAVRSLCVEGLGHTADQTDRES